MRQVTSNRPGQRKRKQQEKKEFGDVVSTEWGKGENTNARLEYVV